MSAAHLELAQPARIPISRIRVHPRNIRSKLTGVAALSRSVAEEGVLVPLLVHRKFTRGAGTQDLELVAGHRRLAAAELAGLRDVPGVVLPRMRDDEVLLAQIAENVQRRAVPPADLAAAVHRLRVEFGMPDKTIAARLGVTVDDVLAFGDGAVPRAVAAPVRVPRPRPAPPSVHRQVVRPPRVTARRVYDLLAEHDADPGVDVAGRLRGMLGGWEPES